MMPNPVLPQPDSVNGHTPTGRARLNSEAARGGPAALASQRPINAARDGDGSNWTAWWSELNIASLQEIA
jgi:hypothetical protein